jgi:hypothetical protein
MEAQTASRYITPADIAGRVWGEKHADSQDFRATQVRALAELRFGNAVRDSTGYFVFSEEQARWLEHVLRAWGHGK